jgi:F-type H+-transporting ATPase subunit a
MADRIASMFSYDPKDFPSGNLISSLTIMAIVAILAIIVGIMAKHQDPLKPSKGLLFWAEYFVEKLTDWTVGIMGEDAEDWAGYFLGLTSYLFLAFIWSITGLPSVIDNIFAPLSLAIVMFVLIQSTAIKYNHWHYFHRYIEPIALFLPINLLTMWTPIISTTLRMFGNALSGFIVIGLLSWFLEGLSGQIFAALGSATWGTLFLAPIPIGVLNLYFGLFSGFIQTLVFASLNAVWIAQERPVHEDAMGVEGQVTRPVENNATI